MKQQRKNKHLLPAILTVLANFGQSACDSAGKVCGGCGRDGLSGTGGAFRGVHHKPESEQCRQRCQHAESRRSRFRGLAY